MKKRLLLEFCKNNKEKSIMGYFEDLFAESELEKELKEKRKVLEDSFYDSPEYKAYDEALEKLTNYC